MRDLIERLEKCTGPDRELDVNLFLAVNPGATRAQHRLGLVRIPCVGGHKLRKLDFYTRSTDSARTMIPEDFRLELKGVNDSWDAFLNDTRAVARAADTHGRSFTPAIAILIAALKARE